MDPMETMTLNRGVEVPALGFGVFQTPADETRDAVRTALASGYRLIDTAAAYGNERQGGRARAGMHCDGCHPPPSQKSAKVADFELAILVGGPGFEPGASRSRTLRSVVQKEPKRSI